jgi:hypothetical protein
MENSVNKQHDLPAVSTTPAIRYLNLIGSRLAAIRADIPHLIDLGQRMARPLLDGGEIYAPPVARFWPHEFGHRAGGLMGLRFGMPSGGNDVAYFSLPDSRWWDPRTDQTLARLIEGESHLFVIGSPEDLQALGNTDRFAGFTGGCRTDEGHYTTDPFRPLATTRQFDQFVRGWILAGEFIAAATRAGRMPLIYMSVWMEGGQARNLSLVRHDNLREPWVPQLFHDNHYVPPLEPGYVAGAFLDEFGKIHATLMDQAPRLATAGRWLANACRENRRTWIVAVGHSYPEILELPAGQEYPLTWGPTVSDLRRALPDDLGEGDVALHLGYSPVDVNDVQRILDRGIRFIYTSPYGRPPGLRDHPNLLWLDLPWRPGDATVDVPGYSARILPASSSSHTMAYFTILCEMAEQMGWR